MTKKKRDIAMGNALLVMALLPIALVAVGYLLDSAVLVFWMLAYGPH